MVTLDEIDEYQMWTYLYSNLYSFDIAITADFMLSYSVNAFVIVLHWYLCGLDSMIMNCFNLMNELHQIDFEYVLYFFNLIFQNLLIIKNDQWV
jgi:hypothetical protein